MASVGFARNYPCLMLAIGLGALGSAAFHPAGATIASARDEARRGAAVSVFSVGGNLGSALSPLWVSTGMGWLGMRGTLVLIPVAVLVSLFLYQQMEWATCAENSQPVIRQDSVKHGAPACMVLIVVATMFRAWFLSTFVTYLPTWMQSQDRSVAVGGQMLFVFLASVGIGSLIGGTLSDRIERWKVLALCLGLLGPAEWLFLSAFGLLQTGLVGMMGMLLGATLPVSIVMAQEAWPRGVGIASGLVMGLGWVPGGIGAWLTGLVADHFSLTVGLRSLALPAVLSAACTLAYTVVRRRTFPVNKRAYFVNDTLSSQTMLMRSQGDPEDVLAAQHKTWREKVWFFDATESKKNGSNCV